MIGPATSSFPRPRARDATTDAVAAARRLASQYHEDLAHLDHVAELALSLFDQLIGAHRLGTAERAMLHVAALLHDIGQADGSKGHHKRSAERIVAAPGLPADPRWRMVVAAAARYHRKALPKARHAYYGELDESDRDRVRWLGGCLRLADGLDKGRRALVHGVHCTLSPHTLLLDCMTHDAAAAANRLGELPKRDLLSRTLARPIECVLHEAAAVNQ